MRGSAYWILVDSAIGCIVSGVLLFLVAVIHWRRICRMSNNDVERDDLLSPKRITLVGMMMLALGAVGLVTEMYLLGSI